MFTSIKRLLSASVILLALQSPFATAQILEPIKPPHVPQDLKVPTGHTPYLVGKAIGTQNYICQFSGSTFFWKPIGPQATLFVPVQTMGGMVLQQITTHFLSPNPLENGTARPTWQSSMDTSAVWAKPIASSTDPKFVAAGAIPWLLLEIVGAQLGPAGGSTLTPTTFIQRVNTTEGAAPAAGCSETTNGNVAFVAYTTDYYFYRATR